MEIAVADAGRFDFDQHLSRSWRRELDLLDGEGLTALPQHRSAGNHRCLPFAVKSGRSAFGRSSTSSNGER
jgi:hypothetical protein